MSQFNYAAGQAMGAMDRSAEQRRRRPVRPGQSPLDVAMGAPSPSVAGIGGPLPPPGTVNPSGPALQARAQRESRLRESGIDPTMLRRELERRRTTDAAMLRQRRALGRKAQMLEAQGDRVGAEQTRAELELLEGSRREAAGDTARSSALLRGGESRLQDTDTIAMIRRNQDVTRRRNALGEQAEDLDLTIAGRGLEARDLQSQAGVVGARTGLVDAETGLTVAGTNQREAQIADSVSSVTAGDRTQIGVRDAQNRLLELEAQEQELQDRIANGQGDRDTARELEALEVERIREEQRLARLRAANEANAEEGTADARQRAAVDRAEADATRAQQEREQAENQQPTEDVVTTIFGPDLSPQERQEEVSKLRANVTALTKMDNTQSGLRGAVNPSNAPAQPVANSSNITVVRKILDDLATRRAAFTPEQYEAYVGFIRSELLREVPQWAGTDSPFVNSLVPSGVGGVVGTALMAGNPIGQAVGMSRGARRANRRTDEANGMWARLRAELGLSGGGGE